MPEYPPPSAASSRGNGDGKRSKRDQRVGPMPRRGGSTFRLSRSLVGITGNRDLSSRKVQRSAKIYANLAKQDPGRARQNRQARAETNFSQPRTSLLADLGGYSCSP